MKSIYSFLLFSLLSFTVAAQRPVTLRALWKQPQVHVIFGQYDIYFLVQDIDKSMQFLPPGLQYQFGNTSGLDTAGNYIIELLPGRTTVYTNQLQDLVQNGVGAYLLMSGHAAIKCGKRNIHNVLVNIGPAMDMGGYQQVPVHVYDPKNSRMIFAGVMAGSMYQKDIGF